ncbi:hypothetical protein FA95DRAFT_1541856 [Auriscalpium vulgare]|uniref:Uncharacterized protein n=1 Tax=Auriscalpium vulgare TaxID=40419 RepID=A0ACB8RRL0_9AGAM|nr:hypothetical protein FA95DRAFT_1541856 [Auriscalpium vulgare]
MSDSNHDASSSRRRSAVTILTNLAQGSAPFISTFLLIHLSAPVMANLGGSSLSSQVMLLGREYYQTSFGERYLLYAPLLIHTGAATLKRLISPRPLRRKTSPLAVTGYTAMLLLLPIHLATHRLYPTIPAPPISALGPSELDYEFVKAGLHAWPVRSALLYGTLVLGVALHTADGLHIIYTTWLPGAKDALFGLSRRTRRAVAGALSVPVLTGLVVLAREPLLAFASMAERYGAVFAQSFVYRF